jgi:hypothetical protein
MAVEQIDGAHRHDDAPQINETHNGGEIPNILQSWKGVLDALAPLNQEQRERVIGATCIVLGLTPEVHGH